MPSCVLVYANEVSACPRRAPLELLRAVEGTLAMMDKLPEFVKADGLPEIEPDIHEPDVPSADETGPAPPETAVVRETWVYIPCLRVETATTSYRYGWPPQREEPHSNFDVAEWQTTLAALLSREQCT